MLKKENGRGAKRGWNTRLTSEERGREESKQASVNEIWPSV